MANHPGTVLSNKLLSHIDGPRVALTFDDGPDPYHTPRILDILAEHGCPATFFVLGTAARNWPGLVRRIVAEGHSLGSHCYSHRRAWFLANSTLRREVALSRQVIADIAGVAPRWFRPPYGQRHAVMLDAAAGHGMMTVLWSRSVIDWGPLATRRGIRRRLQGAAAGDIVLLHDGRRRHNHPERTAAVLPSVLPALVDRGLRFIGLDQWRPV